MITHQNHKLTLSLISELRNANGQFKSSQDVHLLMKAMPSDFPEVAPSDFGYVIKQAGKAPDPAESFYAIIQSNALKRLREVQPAQCASVIAECLNDVPQNRRLTFVDYLLSGPFTFRLSFEAPQAYADFFTKMVASLYEQDGTKYAEARPVPHTPISLFAVFPTPALRLPPYALIIQNDGAFLAKPLTSALHTQLPRLAIEALHKMIDQEALEYSAIENHDMAAVLSQSALYIKPQPSGMTPT